MIYQGKNELCCNADQTDKLQFLNGMDNELYPAKYTSTQHKDYRLQFLITNMSTRTRHGT